ncbi:hypothetical protein RND71_021537 [Anisodus tanguticus]|uniref:Peptidase A1 domain-containing protein n=1 Tax=Anisodus tanguticus TaxID=243964 RepID=A0AAE1RWQ2_9SOLA|nr:hypothetical protein RND71_021537 [Anisodus tanguticus]
MSSSNSYLFNFCFLLTISTCLAQTNFKPKTLFLTVKKDLSTLQYITEIHQRTPLIPVKLAVHLGSENVWVDCETGFKSSTYKPAICDSRQCNLARSTACGDCLTENKTRPGCNNNACDNIVSNPAMDTIYTGGEIAEDVLTIQSIDVSLRGPIVTLPNFIFTCSPSFLTENLGKDVKGMIGFGQQSHIFFALGFDASQDLIYTPIIINPNLYYIKRASPEYYIQVSSITINEKTVPLNKTLLLLDHDDKGGTRISTAIPYTVLEPSIYSALSKAFVNEMPKDVKTVFPVPPFRTCFDSSFIGLSRLGYNAPRINLVFHTPNVYWNITGANSLVKVSQRVVCLAFVERIHPWGQAIVIGGYQMQDNLVEFDLARKRIGFSNSLFFRQTMCSNQFYTN